MSMRSSLSKSSRMQPPAKPFTSNPSGPATFGKRGKSQSDRKTPGGMSHWAGVWFGYSPSVM